MTAVDENSAFAWHSMGAETPESNRENKKLKCSVPDKKDAETPTRRIIDLMTKFKKLKHSMKATNSRRDILSEDAIYNLEKLLEVKNHPRPHPDIFKEDAETLEENARRNSHQEILKKVAAGAEARSKCLDDWKKMFEKVKNDTNSHPDFLKTRDILKKELENMEARVQFLDFVQKHSEKLMSSVKVPISTEREESDDEIEKTVVAPLKSPRLDLILEKNKSRHSEDEAERKRSEDEIKKGAKEILERFESFESVFGVGLWDQAKRVFRDLQ